MNIPTSKVRVILKLTAVAAALVACDTSATGPGESSSSALGLSSGRATVAVEEFPVNVDNYRFYSACLNGVVALSGTAWWTRRTVTLPDGSVNITVKMDVSDPKILFGGSVWTANPGASEMFIHHVPPGGTAFVHDQQLEHQGTVIYKSEDGRPDLRFIHRIHIVRLPGSNEVHLNHSIFAIVCVGQQN
jgi:hypothetical protein